MKPFSIKEEIEELIRIDLKLPHEEEIAFLYVRWDLLISLFSLIGQLEEGNCFAVSVASHLLGHHQDFLIDLLIEVLQKGTFSFEGVEIPLLPLLEGKRSYEKDFRTLLSAESAHRLTGFSLAKEVLSTESGNRIPSERCSLEIMMDSQFKEKKRYAKEVFLSLKYNLLQQALLGILQFCSINSSKNNSLGKTTAISNKTSLLRRLFFQVVGNFNYGPQSQIFQNFLTRFCTRWVEDLWFIDYKSWNQWFESGRLLFDYHNQGLKVDGNISDYFPLMRVRRLSLLKEGKLCPIDRISDLVGYFKALVFELTKEEMNLDDLIMVRGFLSHLLSPLVAQEIAKIVQIENGAKVNFKWEKYYLSDSFFRVQNGRDCRLITLWDRLYTRFAPPYFFSSVNATDFFVQLCIRLYHFGKINFNF
ncbi:MAG: hypothetical protein JJU12_04260 [Chlamydiales bacterium]|nr:hypothetical protein [Chlamydiales bacterium]